MKRKQRAHRIGLLCFVVLITALITIISHNSEKSDMAIRAALLSEEYDMSGEEDIFYYEDYLMEMQKAGDISYLNTEEISVTGDEYTECTYETLESLGDGRIKTGDEGNISYDFTVKESGTYYIEVGYNPTDDGNIAIIRNLYINGKIPFEEAKELVFPRMWKDVDKDFLMETSKNQSSPSQIQAPEWTWVRLESADKSTIGPFLFYFEKGKNTLTLESVKSSMGLSYIKLIPAEGTLSYEEYLASCYENGAQAIDASELTDGAIYIQAEDACFKSSSTLVPLNERTSPMTIPYHSSNIVLNTIGGSAWANAGLSISWELDIPKSGLYRIASRFSQTGNRDFYSVREVKLNGEVPFREAAMIKFYYDSEFQIDYFGGEEGAYYFYLKEGKNLLTMTISLGDLAYAINRTEVSVKNFNELYRRITAVTGTNPDKYRDYEILSSVPDMVNIMKTEYHRLTLVMESLGDSMENNTKTQEVAKMLILLEKLIKKPDEISTKLNYFNTCLTALSEWRLSLGRQSLLLDYMIICTEGYTLPKADGNFFQDLVHQVKSFIGSFTNDYNIENTLGIEHEKSIEVWITTSRDQYEIAQRLINNAFTDSDFGVTLKMVGADSVMPATLTGNSPDVAIQTDYTMPTNFAYRDAAYDLTRFPDFEEVAKRFSEGAMEFFEYEGGYYGLPDQMSFPVMYYRTDILEELGLKIPNTWDELIALIPYLQAENMQIFFITDTAILGGTTSSTTKPGSCVFYSMLYQNGEELYRDNNKASNLDSDTSLLTFKKWTEYYTKQSFNYLLNAQTRFRTGEVPIIIADYTMVNTINVAAPEIDGEWTIKPIPGTIRSDGTFDRTTSCMVGSSIILQKEVEDKDTANEAWEFLKWWTSKEVQLQYAQELRAVLGDSANYPAANLEAVEVIAEELDYEETIRETLKWLRGIKQVPGGYITGRNVENAFITVVTRNVDPVDTLYFKIRYINMEINNKRKEFGLDY